MSLIDRFTNDKNDLGCLKTMQFKKGKDLRINVKSKAKVSPRNNFRQ